MARVSARRGGSRCRRLCGRLHGGFATCVILRIDPKSGCSLASVGHPAPYLNDRELDVPGQVAAIAALGSLAGAFIEGGRAGWSNPGILAAIAMSAVLAMLFVLQERRAAQPMLPLALFRRRRFTLASLVGLLVNIAFYGLIFVLSLYFQQINDLSPLATGLAFVPMMGVVLPVNLLAPRAAEVFGAPLVIAAGAALAAAGCIALLGIGPGTSYWALCAQLVAMGGGLGLLVPPLTRRTIR